MSAVEDDDTADVPDNVVSLHKPKQQQDGGQDVEHYVHEGVVLEPDEHEIPDATGPRRRPRWKETIEGFTEGEAAPVIAPWLSDKGERQAMTHAAAVFAWHRVKFHGVRLVTVYPLQFTWWSPRGAGRLVLRVSRWMTLAEAAPLRADAITKLDPKEWIAQHDRQIAAFHRRKWAIGGASFVVLAALACAWLFAPRWIVFAAVFAAWLTCAVVGAPRGRRAIPPAVIKGEAPRVTYDVIVQALSRIGIPEIAKAVKEDPTTALRWTAPISRAGGGKGGAARGTHVECELPPGCLAVKVAEKRAELASALARPLGSVWVEVSPERHPGHVTLWISDTDVALAKQEPWPLLKAGRTNFFKPFQIGTDPRGRAVTWCPFETNIVVGGIVGAGKTGALRVLAGGPALDPRVECWVAELKGTGDLEDAALYASRYVYGHDDDTIDLLMQWFRELIQEEIPRRAEALRSVPKDLRPDNKVTSEIASMRKLRLHPLSVTVDEIQTLFGHPVAGKEAARYATDAAKLGRALAVHLQLATQRPDKESIPPALLAQIGSRAAMRVRDWRTNNMILGDGAYDQGLNATMFGPRDRGMCWFIGSASHDEAPVNRFHYLDGPAFTGIAQRARAVREAKGWLEGVAAGQLLERPDETAPRDFLADVMGCIGGTETGLWTSTLLVALADLRPAVYEGWTPGQLAAAFRPHGVKAEDVWGTATDGGSPTRRGYKAAAIRAAIDKREG